MTQLIVNLAFTVEMCLSRLGAACVQCRRSYKHIQAPRASKSFQHSVDLQQAEHHRIYLSLMRSKKLCGFTLKLNTEADDRNKRVKILGMWRHSV